MACNKMPAVDGFAHDFGATVNKISDGEECCLDVVPVQNIQNTVGVLTRTVVEGQINIFCAAGVGLRRRLRRYSICGRRCRR